MEPEVLQPVVPRIITTKDSKWPQSTTNKTPLLRLIIFEVVCKVNPIEPLLLLLNKWMEHGNTSKNGNLCPCSTKNINRCTKKDALGPTAGHCVTVLPCCSLWLLRYHKRSGTEASRRGKNWKSECRPDMIRMIENHRFLMFFFGPLKSKIESPRKRNVNFHSWVTRLPIEMNVHVANIFWGLLQIPAF